MTRRGGRFDAAAGGALLAIAALRVALDTWQVLRGPVGTLTSRVHDDGWYYLVIARSLAHGHGPAFGTAEATNGYQPLWQGALAASATVVSGTAAVRAALLLGAVGTIAAFALVLRTVHRIRPVSLVGAGAVAVVVTAPPVWHRAVDGMETPAVLLGAALVVAAADRWWRRVDLRSAALAGAACGLLVLGRLSGAAVVVLVPVALGLARRPARPWRHLAVWAAAVVVLVAPWAVWSRAETGTWRPVTLRVKGAIEEQASGPLLSDRRVRPFSRAVAEEASTQLDATVPGARHLPGPPHRALVALGTAAAAALASVAVRRRPELLVVAVPVGAATARVAVDLLLVPSAVPPWYGAVLVLPSSLALLAAVEVVRTALRARRWAPAARSLPAWSAVAAVAVIAGLGAVLATAPDGRGRGTWEQADREAALAVPRFGSPERTGAFDAGVVGWFAPGARNLDGLVRGPAYVDRFEHGAPGPALILAEPIDLLVNRTADGDGRVPACAVARWRSPTTVQLADGPALPVTIWDLRPCRSG